MSYIALIDGNNKVVNVVVPPTIASQWTYPAGFTAVTTDTGNIGDTYNPADGSFTPPVEEG